MPRAIWPHCLSLQARLPEQNLEWPLLAFLGHDHEKLHCQKMSGTKNCIMGPDTEILLVELMCPGGAKNMHLFTMIPKVKA